MGLQVLGNTLKASLNELGMILFLLTFSVIIFSSGIYYAEHEMEHETFNSIPDAFWYSLVTITTVGYGDHVPLTLPGKLIGGACAISGVLTVAMAVPVVVNNFDFYHKRPRIMMAHREEKRLSVRESLRTAVMTAELATPELAMLNPPT